MKSYDSDLYDSLEHILCNSLITSGGQQMIHLLITMCISRIVAGLSFHITQNGWKLIGKGGFC